MPKKQILNGVRIGPPKPNQGTTARFQKIFN